MSKDSYVFPFKTTLVDGDMFLIKDSEDFLLEKVILESDLKTALGVAKKGYVIKVGYASITYADSTSYFYGAMLNQVVPVATTPDDRRSFTAFETGIVDKIVVHIVTNSGSNTEVVTLKIHNSTAATTTAALGTMDLSSTGATFRWIFTGINFAVTSGDKLHIQIDVPVYATNPTIIMFADVFLKPS